MITPTKYMNLDYSLLNVSSILISEFNKQPIITYDEVLQITLNKIGKQAKEITPYALNFLFLLGIIDYHNTLDSFERKL